MRLFNPLRLVRMVRLCPVEKRIDGIAEVVLETSISISISIWKESDRKRVCVPNNATDETPPTSPDNAPHPPPTSSSRRPAAHTLPL